MGHGQYLETCRFKDQKTNSRARKASFAFSNGFLTHQHDSISVRKGPQQLARFLETFRELGLRDDVYVPNYGLAERASRRFQKEKRQSGDLLNWGKKVRRAKEDRSERASLTRRGPDAIYIYTHTSVRVSVSRSALGLFGCFFSSHFFRKISSFFRRAGTSSAPAAARTASCSLFQALRFFIEKKFHSLSLSQKSPQKKSLF